MGNTISSKVLAGHIRWLMVAAAVVLALAYWALPTPGSAWKSWSGTDPVIDINNGEHLLSIYLEWPTEFTCDVNGPVQVTVQVPKGTDATVVSESSDDFGCQVISTETTIREKGGKNNTSVDVSAWVKTGAHHPVNVHVTLDGNTTVFSGHSNGVVRGSVSLE